MGRAQSRDEKLAATLALGRRRFVIRYGVLLWGITTALLFSLVMGLLRGWEDYLLHLALALVIFPLGGTLWGRWMWSFLQREARKAGIDVRD